MICNALRAFHTTPDPSSPLGELHIAWAIIACCVHMKFAKSCQKQPFLEILHQAEELNSLGRLHWDRRHAETWGQRFLVLTLVGRFS